MVGTAVSLAGAGARATPSRFYQKGFRMGRTQLTTSIGPDPFVDTLFAFLAPPLQESVGCTEMALGVDGWAASMTAKNRFASLLRSADIEIDGSDPWDLRVHDNRLYAHVLAHGSLGAGESYMDGWWDVEQLDEFFARVHRAKLGRQLVTIGVLAQIALSKLGNPQGRVLSRRVAQQHYDLSNDLYVAMLGRTMQYTCAYYGPDGVSSTLDEAQDRKLDLIVRKLHLQPGMTVLELGGGFGGLAYHLAKHHRCRVVSYNISREQVEFARAWCEGLPVEFRLQDYREAPAPW